MLTHLHIQNFALIDQIEIDLSRGLSVITGETGAGKSILLGALGLILGKRADHTILKNKGRKCIVEGSFFIKDYPLKALFDKYDLDYSEESTLRREINGNGKSRSFINDTPCTLDVLKLIGGQLIDIHSQQQSKQINDPLFQLEVLDALAKNSELLQKYKLSYSIFKSLKIKFAEATAAALTLSKEQDFLNFQFKELESLDLKKGENEALEIEQIRFSNSEDVLNSLQQIQLLLEEDEDNLISKMGKLKQLISTVSKFDSGLDGFVERTQSLYLELQDMNSELSDKASDFEYQPERHQLVEERLGEIHRLHKKHGVESVEDLMELKNTLEEQLISISSSDERLDKLKQSIQGERNKLENFSSQLTKKRLAVISALQLKVEGTLKSLGISHAQFIVSFEPKNDFSSVGKDSFQFLFSANKGVVPTLVSKTASGGESSRLMLAIKDILAEHQQLPTILFDEIDTGVSGEIAEKMGAILSTMGEKRQVISITHLPQLAAKGNHHYFVFKDDSSERSITQIKRLTTDERLEELAKMLSGAKLTVAAMNNAKELLHQTG